MNIVCVAAHQDDIELLAAYDVRWFDEPLPPDDLVAYARLRARAPLPIAGGEVLTRRQSFRPWIEGGTLDVVQPDCSSGGLGRDDPERQPASGVVGQQPAGGRCHWSSC
jgi:hypothetical protein